MKLTENAINVLNNIKNVRVCENFVITGNPLDLANYHDGLEINTRKVELKEVLNVLRKINLPEIKKFLKGMKKEACFGGFELVFVNVN